ncbi:exodeoxyribonuclease III [Anthocerotibacter panamensis]|uniref:exodeoxyribonuclease III n=1 Tax=Anthocerotibacter panamensis TaxID=2857077 RepID=UPI001C40582F|nr:exodeoxyribonuclease III [Anthocerotibacter panamensis]
MNIVSWNVNSISARLHILTPWLEQRQPDVLCVQETKTPDDKFPRAVFEDLGYELAIAGQKSYNGVAMLSKRGLDHVHIGLPHDQTSGQQRLIGATVQGIQILNTYIPNGSAVGSEKFSYKLQWLASLEALLTKYFDPERPVLLCGDFNICPGDLDVFDVKAMQGEVGFHPDERTALERIRAWGLVDTFRLCHPTEQQFSWWDYRQNSLRRNRGLRIDHIWVTKILAQRCTRAWIDKEPRLLEKPSDHAPVGAEFQALG